jgi:thiamine kinase-like enzyme
VAQKWKQERWKAENELSTSDYWDNLGERLQSASEQCGKLAHPFADKELSVAYKRHRTFTHGDPKSANIFFRKREDIIQVGLIDFQWSGFGLATTDIAHFMSAAIDASLLVDGGEKDLMQYYYDELLKYLVDFGAYESMEKVQESFSYDVFNDQYEIAMLDICRLGEPGLNSARSNLCLSHTLLSSHCIYMVKIHRERGQDRRGWLRQNYE